MGRFFRSMLVTAALLAGLVGLLLALGGDLAPRPAASQERIADASSLESFHYQGLNEYEQAAYAALYEGISERRQSFDITVPDVEDIEAALHALVEDHPEFFWLSGSCTYTPLMLGGVNVELGFNVAADELDAIQAAIDAETSAWVAALPASASSYDKVRAAYEWVINSTDYGHDSVQNQNIQSVFLDHVSVCAGYAKAMQYLLAQVGVPCAYVRGTIATDGVEHAWNLVDIDGTLTYVDATWGDPTYTGAGGETYTGNISYDFLCLTSEEMARTHHVANESPPAPECSSGAYDYYRLSGLLFDEYDKGQTDAAFRAAFDAGQTGVAFKFANDQAYGRALDALQGTEMLEGTFVELAAAYQGTGDAVRYQITYTDELRVMKIFW